MFGGAKCLGNKTEWGKPGWSGNHSFTHEGHVTKVIIELRFEGGEGMIHANFCFVLFCFRGNSSQGQGTSSANILR